MAPAHLWCSVFAAAITLAAGAQAKRYGVSSPKGKAIYDGGETFEEVEDQRTRQFVVEVAVGAGPEGNLGLLLGWINQPIRGLEYYVGFGFESNPARSYTGAVRYLFNIEGYRPYIGAGYFYRDLYELRTYSHNAFAEVGYSWVLHATYHLTVGVGLRRILHVGIHSDSPLLAEDTDPELLADAQDRLPRWMPMAAVRFSRAF